MNELQSAVPHIYGPKHAHVFEEYVKPRLLILVHVRGYVNDQITLIQTNLRINEAVAWMHAFGKHY